MGEDGGLLPGGDLEMGPEVCVGVHQGRAWAMGRGCWTPCILLSTLSLASGRPRLGGQLCETVCS